MLIIHNFFKLYALLLIYWHYCFPSPHCVSPVFMSVLLTYHLSLIWYILHTDAASVISIFLWFKKKKNLFYCSPSVPGTFYRLMSLNRIFPLSKYSFPSLSSFFSDSSKVSTNVTTQWCLLHVPQTELVILSWLFPEYTVITWL